MTVEENNFMKIYREVMKEQPRPYRVSGSAIDPNAATVAAKRFALHIAEQAVAEELNKYPDPYKDKLIRKSLRNTLSRIKTLTENEG